MTYERALADAGSAFLLKKKLESKELRKLSRGAYSKIEVESLAQIRDSYLADGLSYEQARARDAQDAILYEHRGQVYEHRGHMHV